MKAKRQIESSLNSVTMLDGTGGHVSVIFEGKEGEAALRANSSGVKYLSAECGRREL